MPRVLAQANPIMTRALNASRLLSADEERAAARSGNRDALVLGNLRLLYKIARENAAYGVAHEELCSEGALGLAEAASRFDPERGVRFTVYAQWWVRAYIWRFIGNNRRCVRLTSSRTLRRLGIELRKTQKLLRQQLMDEPSAAQLAEHLGVTEQDISYAEVSMGGRDRSYGSGEGEIERTTPALQEERAIAQQQQHAIEHWIEDSLDRRSQFVLRKRFFEVETATLDVIGKKFGVSRERVRQMEAAALEQLQDSGLLEAPCESPMRSRLWNRARKQPSPE